MSIIVSNLYRVGETFTRYQEVRVRGTLTDPNTHIKITITDPAGTKKVDGTAMTKEDTGKYVHYYDIPDATASNGFWNGYVEASGTNGEARDYFQFEVTGG